MDRYGFVGRGYHGTRPLSRADRSRLYREQQLRLSAARYSWIDTLFAIPEAVLYAQLVDFLDRDADFVSATADSRAARYTQLWTDIRESIDEAHRDDSIKREITANLGDYIVQDPELAATLHRFRSAGKRLFLLTNSGFAYTDRVMSYLLSDRLPNYPSWRSYFDAVIVDAQKPAFFVDSRPLLRLDSDGQVVGVVPESASSLAAPSPSERAAEAPSGLAAELRSSAAAVGAGQPWLLQGGNVRILSAVLGLPADRVLYIGDHIYGDMLRAKRSSVWRTAMVVQELEEELDRHAQVEAALQQLEALDRRRHRLDAELRYQQLLAQQLEQLSEAAVGELLPDPAQSPLPPSPQWALELSPVAMAAALRVAGAVDELGRRAMLDGAGSELRRRIAELDAGLLSTVAEISRLERDIEHTFNPFWGPLFKESTENSRLGEQVEDYACLYTSRVSNFLAYSPFQYFRSPRDHLPHERVY
jgi:HAD superfamily 5'-nucleotidase-like hydrolase